MVPNVRASGRALRGWGLPFSKKSKSTAISSTLTTNSHPINCPHNCTCPPCFNCYCAVRYGAGSFRYPLLISLAYSICLPSCPYCRPCYNTRSDQGQDLLSGDTNRVGIRVINNPGLHEGGLFVVDLKRDLLGHAAQ